MIIQTEVVLPPMKRGFHNITHIIVDSLQEFPETGLLNVFVKHTSAALTITENADPYVLADLNMLLERIAPESDPNYKHTLEGPDDMPSHLKSLVTGASLNIPITKGKLNLGTWQGIFFCEFRNHGGNRKIVLTLYY